MEVYCRIQNPQEDDIKIQLASLRLEGASLVWWEAKTQEEMRIHGKISISWVEFVYAIKRHFYPLAYMKKGIMSWKIFGQLKGLTVQYYTQEFRKRALLLGVKLNSQDTLLTYIGGLHSNLKHTILMFNPSNLDEVCVQAMHLEASGKNIQEEGRKKKPFKGKEKEKG